MRAGVIQIAPEFGKPERNLARAAAIAREHPADLLVLPELVTTGYHFADREEALSLAEPVPDGPSVAAFADLARETGGAICFGIAERAPGDVLYNSALLVDGDGVLLHYRKNHLFLAEKDVFRPGDLGFPVTDLAGGAARVGILICFDYMFPEAARSLALAGAEILLHPSNLITTFGHGTMAVRSLENGVFSLLSNRTGTEERSGRDPLVFTGASRVLGPRGEVLASLGEEEEGAAIAEIDPARARNKAVTPRNDLLRDRRPALYGLLTDRIEGDEE